MPESTVAILAPLLPGPNGWGDELLIGALMTLKLGLTALGIGIGLGFILVALKLSSFAPVRWIGNLYTLIIRGTPEFLVLLLVYFGSERMINHSLLAFGIDLQITIPKFTAAVAGLALIFAAYASEVLRGAYMAVPRGQIEAASAIGMSSIQLFLRVRLPQMWRFAIPGLGNLWMVMLKDTSLAAVIAVDELLRVSKLAGETTRVPLLFFCAAALLYLFMTAVSDIIKSRLESKARIAY